MDIVINGSNYSINKEILEECHFSVLLKMWKKC